MSKNIGSTKEFLTSCPKCKYEWWTTLKRLEKYKCPRCRGKNKGLNDVKIKLLKRNIVLLYDIDNLMTSKKYNFQCKEDGFKWAAALNRVVDENTGCPKIQNVRIVKEESNTVLKC